MRILRALTLLAALLAAISPAAAQPAGDGPVSDEAGAGREATAETPLPQDEAAIAEARQRYAQGAEFFRRERYSAAIAELSEAYRLWQNPVILYSLAQAYEGDGQVQASIETYQRYLDTTPEGDARRGDVQGRINLLNNLLATVHIASSAPGTVFVNGVEAGSVPGSIRVSTGRHQIEVRAEGFRPERQTLTVAAGTERELSFTLVADETRTEIIRVTEEREPLRFPRTVFMVTAGVTAAAAGTWVGLAGTAVRQANRYNAEPVRTESERADARRWSRRADVMLGVAGGLAVGTLVVGLLTKWDDDDGSGGDADGDAGATGPAPEANVVPQRGGALLLLGWRR